MSNANSRGGLTELPKNEAELPLEAGDCMTPKRLKMDNQGNKELNPMLLDLVVENVFSYFRRRSLSSLKNFRLVCKLWDSEARKIIHHDTVTDLLNILSTYPHGLGWTECVNADKTESFYYQVPYSSVLSFDNIFVSGTCEFLSDEKVIRWFQIQGSTVKTLRFRSTLVCYHHTRFLECVLKLWCKNLKSLYLEGIACYDNLSHCSGFDGPTSTFICDNLTEVILSAETEALHSTNCEENVQSTYLNFSDRTVDEDIRKRNDETTENFIKFITEVVHTDGWTDGGVVGKIFKSSAIEKIIIKDFLAEHIDALMLSINGRSSKTVKSLKYFEYENSPVFTWGWQMDKFRKFQPPRPLTTLRIGALTTHINGSDLEQLLLSFKNTLEHVEFNGSVQISSWEEYEEQEYLHVKIPLLPKVKTFKNGNIFCTRVGGLDFVKHLPKLEKCSLTCATYHSSIFPLNPSQVFNLLFQAASFENCTHPLKELHLDGKINYSRHIQLLKDWFPNLKKIDLTLDGSDVFVEFLRQMKFSQLEDIKIRFISTDQKWCMLGIINSIPLMTHLQFVELRHESDNPIALTVEAFTEGFALLPKLTSLSLWNFAMFVDEIDDIRSSISHLGSFKLQKCVLQFKPVDVEFSVGCTHSFPNLST
ncbi:unnamed protein product [Orchesella dallaii]|uniref:F-box domain-containing protein n=1 Tax=Orchesella dallaii TaxID=48710 RepID=A0ABP1Q891_9HEXA